MKIQECEICGKKDELKASTVEGVVLQVCTHCSRYGTPFNEPLGKKIATPRPRWALTAPISAVKTYLGLDYRVHFKKALYIPQKPYFKETDPLLAKAVLLIFIASIVQFFIFFFLKKVDYMYVFLSMMSWICITYLLYHSLEIFHIAVLDKKTKLVYTFSAIFVIFAAHFILYYPINPENEINSGLLESAGFAVSIAGELCSCVIFVLQVEEFLVERDLICYELTGKTTWQIRDSYIRKREISLVIAILLSIPAVILVGFVLGGLFFNILNIYGVTYALSILLSTIPPLAVLGGFFWILYRLNKEIKARMNFLVTGDEKKNWHKTVIPLMSESEVDSVLIGSNDPTIKKLRKKILVSHFSFFPLVLVIIAIITILSTSIPVPRNFSELSQLLFSIILVAIIIAIWRVRTARLSQKIIQRIKVLKSGEI